MIGKQKANWLVLAANGRNKHGNRLWHCKCLCCGLKRTWTTSQINFKERKGGEGYCQNCRPKRNDEKSKTQWINKRIGSWTVVKNAGKNKHGSRLWLCRCDCGTERIMMTRDLSPKTEKKWQATRCKRCELIEMELSNRVTEMPNRFWARVKEHANRRGLKFEITRDDALNEFQKQSGQCALTGLNLHFTKLRTNYYRYTNASLDRIDSSKGYIPGNIQWVEKRINMMKNTHNQSEFISLCHLVSGKALGRLLPAPTI